MDRPPFVAVLADPLWPGPARGLLVELRGVPLVHARGAYRVPRAVRGHGSAGGIVDMLAYVPRATRRAYGDLTPDSEGDIR